MIQARLLNQAAVWRWGLSEAHSPNPVLVWLFFITVLMYTYSHIPFVFGQPFILEALNETGFQADAPLVSGVVSGDDDGRVCNHVHVCTGDQGTDWVCLEFSFLPSACRSRCAAFSR